MRRSSATKGRLDFVDSAFDPRSGTIRNRAVVPNPDLFLTPGSFARLRLLAGDASALMVPDAAVVADQSGRMVLTVAPDGTVAPRPVQLGPLVDGLRVVRGGLEPEDRVIIGGLHRARPGARVTAEQGRIGPSPLASAAAVTARRALPERPPRRAPLSGEHRAMRLARFFIDRPVFAAVISITITLVGAIAALRLPIAEYPDIAPPTVQVTALYPGASAETIAQTVAGPIEQEVNGVDGMLYLSSQSTGDGRLTVSVVFRQGTDVDQAQVLVQNRVSVAEPRLPEEVRRLGITVKKASPDLLMVVHMTSPDGSRSPEYVSNYATLAIKDRLARLDGVGDAQVFGARDYAMRVWLDPDRVAARGLSPGEVVEALRRANAQVAAGAIGQAPRAAEAGAFEISVQALGRLVSPEQFDEQVVATGANGAPVRLRDVARTEIGAADYTVNALLNNQVATAIVIFQRPGSNALETAAAVRRTMEDAAGELPLRHRLERGLRPDPLHRAEHGGGAPHLRRGGAAGGAGGDPVPAELARGGDPAARHPGLHRRHLRRAAGARLHAEHADHVRLHPGHRHRGGRRHRGGGERRAAHGGGHVAAGGGAAHHGRGRLRADRHRAGAGGGVRADRLHHRHLRRLLQAVRGDHLGRHAVLRAGVADALAGAGGAAAEAARPRRRRGHRLLAPVGLFFRGFNWLFDRLSLGYGGLTRRLVRLPVILLLVYAGLLAADGAERADHADRPDPAARPRLLHRRLPAAARRQPEPHGRGGAPRLGGDHGDAGRRETPSPSSASTAPPSPTRPTPASSSPA